MTNTFIAKILNMTPQGVGKWRKEKRPIISLTEKYFTKKDLEEFLETGKINKLERYEELIEIEKKYNEIIKITSGKGK